MSAFGTRTCLTALLCARTSSIVPPPRQTSPHFSGHSRHDDPHYIALADRSPGCGPSTLPYSSNHSRLHGVASPASQLHIIPRIPGAFIISFFSVLAGVVDPRAVDILRPTQLKSPDLPPQNIYIFHINSSMTSTQRAKTQNMP
ncbi:hypothetical protein C8R43DRAFT_1020392 [Mycena crocata]|nr:hypothetical protein C8R43DRAFT_1020392 [Mycena crocata]